MWCWWSARNKINAGEKVKTAQQIVSHVLFHLQAWRDAVSTEKRDGDHHLKKFTRLIAMQLTVRAHANLGGVSS
jgi:hypothetical protein